MAEKIVVGMSGGVDSAMSLLLLKQQGWEPVGVSLRLPVWEKGRLCEKGETFESARAVCEKLGVPHQIIDAQKNFERCVINFLVSELKSGRTPNPCAECNRVFKFSELFKFARSLGISHVATGHYARSTGKGELLRAKDSSKDQTYGLCFLKKAQLARIVFPLGNLLKADVFKLAEKNGFHTLLKRKQSQDLCFVSGTELPNFIYDKLGRSPGRIVDTEGRRLGEHRGLHFHTIGQRRHLGLLGKYFVKSIDRANNKLVVTANRKEILQSEARIAGLHFISGKLPGKDIPVLAKVRNAQKPVEAVLHPLPGKEAFVTFKTPIDAVAPGQVCAFYSGEKCLGGGIIIA